ncbi:Secreted protein [Colletotrichum higginsianum IMI 349063]|uniref:Secreted protein n=1 Tax=Colletotrichum higginsianum (strain IMI 349063) TaxID=759273 RepID=A0A1B7Y7Q1_COLHI|nr:Secreted protein [Colletotrichum higginsianum IMI 349063]OBR08093.1 Secreted protein [Colletotrichum higginsianum IMI 349063]GJC97816.1 secreted protein [Colletotrichum higginsianum]
MSFLTTALVLASTAQAYHQINAKVAFRKNIDPIVQPGEYTSHMHTFFGSDQVTVNTKTSAEAQTGCNTNDNPNDLSIYWIPTLYGVKGGDRIPIEPLSFKAYYNNIGDAEVTFPQDFKVVAGNADATSQADVDARSRLEWFCNVGGGQGTKDASAFPTSTCDRGRLQAILTFQDCFNPATMATAYSGGEHRQNSNWCPTGMKRIPQLRFSVRYDVSAAGSWNGVAPLELASGPSYSFHGDFINGWLPEAAENLMAATDKREWQPVGGPGRAQACTPADPDPENGTSDWAESVRAMEGAGNNAVAPTVPGATVEAKETPATPATEEDDICYRKRALRAMKRVSRIARLSVRI